MDERAFTTNPEILVRVSSQMMMKRGTFQHAADVVIVGGGVIGLSIARDLALRGVKDVLLIERGSLGAEASFAAAGILGPQAEADKLDDFFQLACQSRDLYPAFARALETETGIDIELDTSGTLYLAFTDHDEAEIEKRREWQERAGLAVQKLTAVEARQLEPCISDRVRAALRFPYDVQVENRRLISALADSIQQLGVRVSVGTNVESVNIQRGQIVGVETSRGFFNTPCAVVAGGAWASFIKGLPNIQIEPVRGQMVCLETRPRLTRHLLYSPRGYLVPRRDGRILAGSTTERAGFDKRVTAEGIKSILSHALEISRSVAGLPLVDSWAGLRPRTPDGLPLLGRCGEIEGLFYAAGHYRNGILLAPITGKLIAEAIVDKLVPPILAAFSPDRFGHVFVN